MFSLGGTDITILLANIFILCIQCRAFPLQWKAFEIKLIREWGTHCDPTNYSPVKHIPMVPGSMESLIWGSRLSTIWKVNMSTPENPAFFERRPALLAWLTAVSIESSVLAIILDLSEAYRSEFNRKASNKIDSFDFVVPVLWFIT